MSIVTSDALRRHADIVAKHDDPDTATALRWAATRIDELEAMLGKLAAVPLRPPGDPLCLMRYAAACQEMLPWVRVELRLGSIGPYVLLRSPALHHEFPVIVLPCGAVEIKCAPVHANRASEISIRRIAPVVHVTSTLRHVDALPARLYELTIPIGNGFKMPTVHVWPVAAPMPTMRIEVEGSDTEFVILAGVAVSIEFTHDDNSCRLRIGKD